MKRQLENIWRRLRRKELGQDWISILFSLIFWEIISVPGENLDENTFSELAEKIPNEEGVVKAFELAPEGYYNRNLSYAGKFRELLDWMC